MVGAIACLLLFIIVVSACCFSGDGSSSGKTTGNSTRKSTYGNGNSGYNRYAYSECPSCGAPFYDGFCEECGYPDINQGWLGEEY